MCVFQVSVLLEQDWITMSLVSWMELFDGLRLGNCKIFQYLHSRRGGFEAALSTVELRDVVWFNGYSYPSPATVDVILSS